MTHGFECNRVVVVHRPADPVISATLVYAGLAVVYSTDQLAVWAPLWWWEAEGAHLIHDGPERDRAVAIQPPARFEVVG